MPKELFPLGRMPAIAHIVSEFVQAGILRIVLVVAEQNLALMRGLFDPSMAPPPKMASDPLIRHFETLLTRAEIIMIRQSGNYGNAMPLILAAEEVGNEPCIYAFGDDVIFGENVTTGLLAVYGQTGRPVMAAQEVVPAKKSSFGIIETRLEKGLHSITRLVEKPKEGETASNLASFGRYLVTPDLMRVLRDTPPGRDGEIWFVDGVIEQISGGKRIFAFPLTTGTWYTVGDPKSYADAVRAATDVESTIAAELIAR
jgi:UTP--glucose-1-phosphate uridylyltransferase